MGKTCLKNPLWNTDTKTWTQQFIAKKRWVRGQSFCVQFFHPLAVFFPASVFCQAGLCCTGWRSLGTARTSGVCPVAGKANERSRTQSEGNKYIQCIENRNNMHVKSGLNVNAASNGWQSRGSLCKNVNRVISGSRVDSHNHWSAIWQSFTLPDCY